MSNVNKILLKNHQARFLHEKNMGKEVLVFIPGNLQEIETIKDFNQGFSRLFDYWVIELPGTGMTKPLHPSFSILFVAECLADFLDQYIDVKVNLVACSYATPIALEVAKRYPDKINRLVLAGSMKDIPHEEWATVLGLMADCLRDPGRFAEGFMDLLTQESEQIPRQSTIIKATMRKACRYTEEQFWCFIYNSIRLMTYQSTDLQTITCPTLCFTGELDPYVTKERCRELATMIPGAYFTTVPGTDHLFHIEKPQETIQLISNYLLEEQRQVA